jgi:hypothetical protein
MMSTDDGRQPFGKPVGLGSEGSTIMDPVACRRLICTRASGESFEVTITVGQPYSDSGTTRCPVAIYPLYERLPDIDGVDSWQALQLAMELVERLLRSELEWGSRLSWPREGCDEESEYECR